MPSCPLEATFAYYKVWKFSNEERGREGGGAVGGEASKVAGKNSNLNLHLTTIKNQNRTVNPNPSLPPSKAEKDEGNENVRRKKGGRLPTPRRSGKPENSIKRGVGTRYLLCDKPFLPF
ncbi:hypothetical protein HF086_010871 [Spodoptera exigua]|uniref:Uncharacterized protein n=1 Tax=Spodoptera exigua TaxID=7107 RepID=A0A922MCZ4_SPOEX|nr:hypothetical protein HF086_010871 [Spodoptera exigua]